MKDIIKFVFFQALKDPLYLFWYIIRLFQPSYAIGVNFYGFEELFQVILKEKKSIIRMGDGEAFLIHHGSIGYQTYHPLLRKGLLDIIDTYSPGSNYILCLPAMDINKTNIELKAKNRLRCWLPLKVLYSQRFCKEMKYGDAVAFYYQEYKLFLQKILRERNIIIIGNEDVIISLNKEYLSACVSVTTIICNKTNAFSQKDSLTVNVNKIVKDNHKDYLLVLACGPLSKILAYEFSRIGVQSIDIGRGIELISTNVQGDLRSAL